MKCCNFIVNLGRSLGRDLTVEFMFNLGFFPLEGNPSLYMRELYCGCVCVYSEQEGEMRLCESEEEITMDSIVGCLSSFCWII